MANLVSRAIRPLLVLLIILLASVGTRSASGQGTLDQFLTGNPDCPSNTFKGYSGVSTSQRQEVVPDLTTLISFDVCVQGGDTPYTVDINVRSGSVAQPGEILTSGSAEMTGSGWVHIFLEDPPSNVTGQKLILEMLSAGPFSWFGTCGQIIGVCTEISPDLYLPGGTNNPAITDFAFRSYGQAPYFLPWADFDCSNSVQPADGLGALHEMADANFDLDCLTFGNEYPVDGINRIWGDINCDGAFNLRDILDVFAYKAGLTVEQAQGCPALEDVVGVSL